MVYQGMNSEYYTGMKVPYYRASTHLESAKTQEWSGTLSQTVLDFTLDAHMLTS